MKKCLKCLVDKSPEDFHKRNSGLQSWCKDCVKQSNNSYYTKNKQKCIDRAIARKSQIRDYVQKIKSETPCKDCGQRFHFCIMDFDHLGDKEFNISDGLVDGLSFTKVAQEIAKCEVVCANCHRLRTFNRNLSRKVGASPT